MTRPRMLDDSQWDKIKPFLPKRLRSKAGGRPPADDRECLEGILWVLKTGARWRDLPEGFPSPSTCWRRLVYWEEEGVLDVIFESFLKTLDDLGILDWKEVFIDATFSPAKKGGNMWDPLSGGKAQSWFWWRMAGVFQSHVGLRELAQLKSRSPRGRSKK